MNRYLLLPLLLTAMLLFQGCGKKDESETKDTAAGSNLLDEIAGFDSESEGSGKGTRTVQKLHDTEFAKQVSALTKKANEFEAKFEFEKAVEVWNEIQKIVANKYGEDSWQTTNVRLATETAQKETEFTNEQRKVLKAIGQHQQRVVQALQNRNNSEAYQNCMHAGLLTKTLFGRRSYLFGRIQIQLAKISQYNKQNDLALAYYQEGLAILQRQMGPVHPDIEQVLFSIGQIFQQSNKTRQAIPYLAESANMSRKIWGAEDLSYAMRCHDLGVAHHQLKDLSQAEQFLSLSESIRRKQLGNEHPQLAQSLRNLAVVYQDQQKYKKSINCYVDAQTIFEEKFGPDNEFTIDTMTKLATVYALEKDYKSCESILASLEAIHKKQWGEDHLVYAQTLFKLSMVLSYQSRYQEAEPMLTKALEIQRMQLGEQHSETKRTVSAYAKLLAKTNRETQAEQLRSGVRTVGHFEEERK